MINAFIVDDEENNRSALRTVLEKNYSTVTVIDEATNADEAFKKINALKPQLVFLDIRMPKKNGFELLKMFPVIDFEVIFITAYDNYAIRAFEFNAVGYILKPIDHGKLKLAVDKAIERINAGLHNDIIIHFVKTLSDKNELVNKFSIHHNGKVIFVNVSDISFIESNEDHTILTLFDNTHYYSSKDLGQFEQVLEAAGNFIRVNKSVVVNANYIKSYSKGELCIIDMKSGRSFEVSRRRKSEILKILKAIG